MRGNWRRARGWSRLVTLACSLLGFASPGAGAADEPPARRPRVGLALGGGAALGIAHAGVLQWFEEHRIPVDFVAGTSMGGLIGGAYATGMSAPAIQELLLDTDWDSLFEGDVPYALETFRRKEDSRNYPVKLELGLRGGFRLPSGLNSGHQVALLLSRIVLPYSSGGSFDELPVPFRCVAVDIDRGEQLVLKDGSLVMALRATMAIPGVFAPVRSQGRLLVDGGILNNVPADVARSMGAEVVIAVSVKRAVDSSKGPSMMRLARRALALMLGDNTRRALEAADVVIDPDLQDFHILDFRKTEELMLRGYQAAEASAAKLLRLSLTPEAWQEHLATRAARQRSGPEESEMVVVEGVSEQTASDLSAQLSEHAGRSLDIERFEDALTRIVGSGRYESASYEVVEQGDAEGLLVRLQEKSHAPPFANFSMEVGSEPETLIVDFGARVTFLDLMGLGSEGRVDLAAGSAQGLAVELYRPFGDLRFFVAPRAFFRETADNVFEGQALVGSYRTQRAGAGFDLGVGPGGNFELRLGVEVDHLDTDVRVGKPTLPELSGRELFFEARLVYDGQESPLIPKAGVRFESSFRHYSQTPATEDELSLFVARLVAARPIWTAGSAFLDLRGGTSFGGSPPQLYQFALGGPFRLGAFTPDEFRGSQFLYASLGFLEPVARLPDFVGGAIQIVGALELGSAFEHLRDARLETNLTGGVVLDTVLGPVFAGGSLGNDWAFSLYVSVGSLFRGSAPSRAGAPFR